MEKINLNDFKIAVVIPAYKVKNQIKTVIKSIPKYISAIYVIDDCCPEKSGKVALTCKDKRIKLIKHKENQGVGGAVISGYKRALQDNMNIVIKIDGDGQMDAKLIPDFINPIVKNRCDYSKGNRFYYLENISRMPTVRLIGNAFLSFLTKLSSGYWDLFDPTNGYTAINTKILKYLPLNKINKRYFFETDMLFRLNTARATVIDVPMDPKYADETSNLKISRVLIEFPYRHLINFIKRIFYNYYLRDMSVASIQLPLGLGLLVFGLYHGITNWISYSDQQISTPIGTIMLSILTVITGIQFILAFLQYDISVIPKK
mgnify:CR=1 FL=1|tara:strand:+ start:2422 stop:3372 length:951 start_codon:yes stop_codon:yes gene_type:complete